MSEKKDKSASPQKENSARSFISLEEEGKLINQMYANLLKEKEEAMKLKLKQEMDNDIHNSFSEKSDENVEEIALPERKMRRRMGIMLENKQKDAAIKFIRMQLTPDELKILPEVDNVVNDFLSEKDFPRLFQTKFSKNVQIPFDFHHKEVREKIEESFNYILKGKATNKTPIKVKAINNKQKPENTVQKHINRKYSLEDEYESDAKSVFSTFSTKFEAKDNAKSRNNEKSKFNTEQPKKEIQSKFCFT